MNQKKGDKPKVEEEKRGNIAKQDSTWPYFLKDQLHLRTYAGFSNQNTHSPISKKQWCRLDRCGLV